MLAREDGLTLTDVLVSITLFVIVFGAVLSFLQISQRIGLREQERATAIGEAEVGLRRMTRELRQATQVFASGTSASSIEVLVTRNGQVLRVRYQCDVLVPGKAYRQCVRASTTDVAVQPSTVGGAVAVDRVLNGSAAAPSTSLFTFSPDAAHPTYVRVQLVVPRGGRVEGGYRGNIVLDNGFYLRNLGTQ